MRPRLDKTNTPDNRKPRYGTKPTQFRLTATDLAAIDAIADDQGLANRAEAVRLAVRIATKKLKLDKKK